MLGFLSATGLDLKDIYDVVIPARTLTRRCDRNEKLSPTESEKLARLIRVYDHTLRVFGTAEKTLYFLRQPKQSFDGRTPLDLVCTESGAELVEGMLWQIEDGVFV